MVIRHVVLISGVLVGGYMYINIIFHKQILLKNRFIFVITTGGQ